jgi:hypothetical protein
MIAGCVYMAKDTLQLSVGKYFDLLHAAEYDILMLVQLKKSLESRKLQAIQDQPNSRRRHLFAKGKG